MTYDFHARYSLTLKNQFTQANAVDFLAGTSSKPPEKLPEITEIEDASVRIQLLSHALPTTFKDHARRGNQRGKAGGFWYWIDEENADRFLKEKQYPLFQKLGLIPDLPDMTYLPVGSWAIRLPFRLDAPYISRDDAGLHILDNPVKKEWVFKLPYIAASQWKGALRAAMVLSLGRWWASLEEDETRSRKTRKALVAWRVQIARLFGTEKGVFIEEKESPSKEVRDEYLDQFGGKDSPVPKKWYRRFLRRFVSKSGFFSGNLFFYPSFFQSLGLEVINPHPRKNSAGEMPIFYETVPEGSEAEMWVVYAPWHSQEENRNVYVGADLDCVVQSIRKMFSIFGFGAKTSSGFGRADLREGGRLLFKADSGEHGIWESRFDSYGDLKEAGQKITTQWQAGEAE